MMNNGNVRRYVTTLALSSALALSSVAVYGQDKPYTEGSVWSVTFVRVKPGMFEVYMREVLPLRKKINEEAKKQGLLVSSHIFNGPANGKDDFDVMFMDEYKNWAAYDGITAKYDAIAQQVIGAEEKQVQIMTKRSDTREILGNKNMQELIIR